MNNNQIPFKCVFRYSLVQCLYYYCDQCTVYIEAPAKNRLIIDKYKELVLANYKEPDLNGHFDDCTKDVLKELYVQEEEIVIRMKKVLK